MTYHNTGCLIYFMDKETKDTYYLQKALELGVDDELAYYVRGMIYNNKEAYQLAINDFTILIEKDSSLIDSCYYQRALCYLNLYNQEKAIEDLNKSIELDSQNSNAYSWRALCYELKEEYDNAISDYKKALELGDKEAEEHITICKQKQIEQTTITSK